MNNEIKKVSKNLWHSTRLRWIFGLLVAISLILGMAIVPVESRRGRGGNITTVEDGLWWAITTITGVGYGDKYPVTTTGRAVGVILETVGVVLFGSVIAYVSVAFLRYQEDFYIRRMMQRFDELETKLEELKKHVDFIIKVRSEK